MYFGYYYSKLELEQLFKSVYKFEGQYRNSIVYKHPEYNLSIKEIKCEEEFPNNIQDTKNSLGWTELYFVNLLSEYPNFVNYKGYHFNGKQLYIITEWVPNSTTLCDYLEQPRDFLECFQVLLQVFICLEILYKKFGIVHNDCIPSNIILEKTEYKPDKYFIFCFENKMYYIKDMGYKVYLWDYSFCKNDKVSFFNLGSILKTVSSGKEIPEKFIDMTRLSTCLLYEKYQNNMFYCIVKNWLYRYFYTNTLAGMCVKPSSANDFHYIKY